MEGEGEGEGRGKEGKDISWCLLLGGIKEREEGRNRGRRRKGGGGERGFIRGKKVGFGRLSYI